MTIKYKAEGKNRKKLAQAIADHLQRELQYAGAPTFAYHVDFYTIDREGSLIFDDRADTEEIEGLLEYLATAGFSVDDDAEPARLELSVAIDENDTDTFGKVEGIIASKATLLKHALGVDDLRIERTAEGICFPWFTADTHPAAICAYKELLCFIVKMAKEQQRVVTKVREVDNEKYAFRCFLLRLGFIGPDYKSSRKILLKNLSGSSAFKTAKEDE